MNETRYSEQSGLARAAEPTFAAESSAPVARSTRDSTRDSTPRRRLSRPRLGFLGVGWIGRDRLEAVRAAGLAEAVAIADPDPSARAAVRERVPKLATCGSLDELLEHDLDGVVIATPSAQHAEQTIRALERGLAVFCQKPLAPTAASTRKIVETARAADRLLGVDFSYRHTRALRAVKRLIEAGEIGRIHAVDLVFHNAYGPDKPWFYRRSLARGGCMMDLGIHLIDLLLWVLDEPAVAAVASHLHLPDVESGAESGAPGDAIDERVEDLAVVQLRLGCGAVARIACSWRIHAGCDAVIEASFYGSKGGASMRNVGGSFYDFVADHHRGTTSVRLVDPPDAWGGGAILEWTRRLAAGEGYDPTCERLIGVADLIDRIYSAWDKPSASDDSKADYVEALAQAGSTQLDGVGRP